MTLAPTEEQTHILDLVRSTASNLMISALAGTGKTSTLEMIEKVAPAKPILYLCFNKKIAEEAKLRMQSTTTVSTFNSLGHRIWARACARNLSLDPKKTQKHFREIVDAAPKVERETIWESYNAVIQGVALAKALGYVPEGKFPNAKRLAGQSALHSALDESPDDLTSDLIDAVLTRSIQSAYDGFIDYNDQIYMPALFGGTFPKFPLVKVDEYQDLNPTNHAMLAKLVYSRLIGVGDPNQNIYGFRGAKPNGMTEALGTYSALSCDLSVSFRCPRAIVENAHWRVPNFKWIKEGGDVRILDQLVPADIPDDAAIISRNNAPLFKMAFLLISHQRSVSVAGSDIGPKLVNTLRRLGPESLSQSQTLSAIADWHAERKAKESKTADDLAECMKVFAQHGSTLGQAIIYAEHLFAQRGTIRLLTGHKAKGLEFSTVYHLDPWLLREDEQDLNLRYVIDTRSKDRLFYIDSRSIR